MAEAQKTKMTIYALDTNVIISHLRDDRFAIKTGGFLRRASEKKNRLVISDVVYAELYTGIHLSGDPKVEEARVQSFLAVNAIEVRAPRSLKVAKRAGELYAEYLKSQGEVIHRILPDFFIAAQAEATSDALVTWNLPDYVDLSLGIRVLTPAQA